VADLPASERPGSVSEGKHSSTSEDAYNILGGRYSVTTAHALFDPKGF
jgi:hypothetical protein